MVSRGAAVSAVLSCVLFGACSFERAETTIAPTSTSKPAGPPTVTGVLVGAAGDRPSTLKPGDTVQLFAQAKYSDGTAADVTNGALWQSSNPVIATVSNEGLLKAAAEGAADISATYQSVPGSLHTEVRKPGCEATTVAPVALTFNAFGTYSGVIQVTTPLSDCRWTAKSDADWLNFQFDPARSGSGNFTYSVPANTTPAARSAHIVVTLGATQVVHTVRQEPPVSCSYVVKPEQHLFTASGGTNFFDVVATPATCTWRATASTYSGIHITGGASATGGGRVTYSVDANFYSFQREEAIQVAGLSGANPPARHVVKVASR